MKNDPANRYTSKDFGRTPHAIEVVMPEKLLHRGVEGSSQDEAFSRERKHPVFVVDLPSRAISMTIGGLAPSQTTNRHRHSYETILYILEGEGSSVIEDRTVAWKAGDAVYIPVWAWHHHTNGSAAAPCRYVACENAPMMQNLGAAVREEEA